MFNYKPKLYKSFLLVGLLIFALSKSVEAQDGKKIFQANCAACHAGDMKSNSTGPALGGIEAQWEDKAKLHDWIKNSTKLIASGYPKAVEVGKISPAIMPPFPLSDAEIDAVLKYIDDKASGKLDAPAAGAAATDGAAKGDDSKSYVIYAIITLLLAVVALVLLYINKNLKKASRKLDGIEGVPVVPARFNKKLIATVAILLMILGGYYTTKALINVNRQINYEPVQPIFYSHKVHAGINQISCLYCHGNGWDSKTAAIPSVNVCMNCHKTIQEYKKGPELKDAKGNIVDGTAEIHKLYDYAGFDPKNPEAWDATKAKPIPWVKIHNLPDPVYFNHSQHIRVGNVQCQTCHGDVTEMDEVKQFSELSMGWCVNCHRETNVNFNYDSTKGNKFYSIYEKYHNDLKSGKIDSIKVKDIGGIECQKCHY